MDLNLLVLFEAVMSTRHVGRAADRLNLSPSAVSHGLARLRTLLKDPVFLRTPKGVVPTERAERLAPMVEIILERVRDVVAMAEPFDPRTSTRRFVIGAPDGVASSLLPPLIRRLVEEAPGINLSFRQLLPKRGEIAPEAIWTPAFSQLDGRELDIAILPTTTVPKRFTTHTLYDECFVVAMRKGHPYGDAPGLGRYCTMRHIVVSESGDPYGNLDIALAASGLSRRIALTVPNFTLALSLLAETDLLCALPRRLVVQQGASLGVTTVKSPVELPNYTLSAVMPEVATRDGALLWLVHELRRLYVRTARGGR